MDTLIRYLLFFIIIEGFVVSGQETPGYENYLIANKRINFDDCYLRSFEYPEPDNFLYTSAVGGVPALPKEFAHMAAIGWSQPGGGIEWNCGGSLITEVFILSAAHCSSQDTIAPDKARMGDLNIADSEDDQFAQEINIAEVIRHEKHRFASSYYDIALFRLEKPIKLHATVCPACLWVDEDFGDIPRLEAAGWGTLGHGEKSSPILNKVELTPSYYKSCNEYYENNSRVKNGLMDHQMCAGDKVMDTCPGDSGGPLEKKLIFHSRRVPFLFGITSFGPACGYTTPAVYTKVSSFIDWIQLKTNTTFNPIDCSVKNYIFRDVDDDVIVGERSNVVGEQESVNAHLANIQKKFTRGFAEQVEIGTIDGKKLCSGILITEEYILTSASCISGNRPTHVNMKQDGKQSSIAKIIIHPSFEHNNSHDIALVRLNELVSFNDDIYPACPWTEDLISMNQKYNGFGKGPLTEDILIETPISEVKIYDLMFDLDLIEHSECNMKYSNKSRTISSNQICAAKENNYLVPGACELDPGNSLINSQTTRLGNTRYIFGVNSIGKNCGFGYLPSVFTKVSSYKNWMESIIFGSTETSSKSVAPTSYSAGSLYFIENDRHAGVCSYLNKNDGFCVPTSECPTLADQFKRKLAQVKFCSLKNGGSICCPSQFIKKKIDKQIDMFVEGCVKGFASFRQDVMQDKHPFFDEYAIFEPSLSKYSGEHPHSAVIGRIEPDGSYDWKCVGSLISASMVIASASCIGPSNPQSYTVVLGRINLDEQEINPAQQFAISKIIQHPDYNPITHSNDMVLIRFNGLLKISKDIVPVCLWKNKTHTSLGLSTVTIAKTSEGNNRLLQARRSTVIDNTRCARQQKHRISDTELCTVTYSFYSTRDSFTLHPGDQLQSHLIHNEFGKYTPYLVGINKFEFENIGKGTPIVYTRISEYLEWIVFIILEN